jgi:hypothetical protein
MVKRVNKKTNEVKRLISFSTEVELDTTVDVDVEMDLDELAASIDDEDRAALLTALQTGGNSQRAEDAYYAFNRGDMNRVRDFLCELAGRIA